MRHALPILLTVLVALCGGEPATADTVENNPLAYTDTDATLEATRPIDHVPFKPGETIELRATYIGLTAGYITMSVRNDTIGNRPLYQLRLNAETSSFIEYIYSLDDRFVSYFDRRGLFSWGYDYHQNHNGSVETRTVRYYHEKEFFTENNERKGPIEKYTQDLLTAMYYIRAQKLTAGDTLNFPLQTGDEYYDVNLKVTESRVATKDGWKDSYELRPILTKSRHKEAAKEHVESISDIRIWLSHDERRIPYKISFPATFGSLQAFLEDYNPH